MKHLEIFFFIVLSSCSSDSAPSNRSDMNRSDVNTAHITKDVGTDSNDLSSSCSTLQWLSESGCTPLTSCTEDEFENLPPSSITDRSCTPLTVCGAGEIEITPPTQNSDRTCTRSFGNVDLVPYYKPGSAWLGDGATAVAARAMVDALFAEVEGLLVTSGDWDATIEIYLTDENNSFANTTFEASSEPVMIDGQEVIAVGPWTEIVLGAADSNGPTDEFGNGHDFAIHFNVSSQFDNPGLLRHELMHGLGAANRIRHPTISDSDMLDGLVAGETTSAGVYDLNLVDKNGAPLIGDYDSNTKKFVVANYAIDATKIEWTDGEAGLFFRGIADSGGSLDMPLGVFRGRNMRAVVILNEPSTLMSASKHPNWNSLDEPDRAFLRAMGYKLRP